MGKTIAELRVVVEHEGKFATTAFISIDKKGDVYAGQRGSWFQRNGIPELFRVSYHRDGNIFQRFLAGPVKSESREPPNQVRGLFELGQTSPTMKWVEFTARPPKPDSSIRRTLTVDGSVFFPNTFTASLIVLEPGRLDLVSEKQEFYREHLILLGSVVADWCTPHIAVVAFTMRSDQWANLDNALIGANTQSAK